MEYNTRVIIDLSKYGMEGSIVMGLPGFTTTKQFQSKLLKYVPRDEKGFPIMEQADVIMSQMLDVLMYVKEAPFECDVDPFFKYMDKVDEASGGRANELFEEMSRIAEAARSGELSPLADSPAAETTDLV